MSQINNGYVSVEEGSNTVTGLYTSFSNVTVGSIFTVRGSNVGYDIASIVSDTELTLSTNYAAPTESNVAYTIVTDFTSPSSIPYINQGDIETAFVLKRSIQKIQDLFNRESGWAVATGSQSQAVNTNYLYDLSSNATVTLPSNPAIGSMIGVGDYQGNFETYNLTLNGNGKKVMGDSSLVLDKGNIVIQLIYIDSVIGWKIVR